MPLVAYSPLPTFAKLANEGEYLLELPRAQTQHIRELHIGLLNMMPDAALQPTERQFIRLIGNSNRIAQLYVHPFTLPGIERSEETKRYIKKYYSSFEELANEGLDVTLDEPSIRAHGSFLGAGGIMVLDDSRDMVAVAHSAMEFFAHESCGKCFPCRIGTARLTERLDSGGPSSVESWRDEVDDIGATMKATSACGLGMAAPLITESLARWFPDQVETHVKSTTS